MVEVLKKIIKYDSNKREYALLKLKKVNIVNDKLVHSHKTCFYKALKNSYMDNLPEHGYNTNVGDFIEGSIVTRKTKPYNINTTIVFTFTCFVPCEENEETFELMVSKYFEKNGKALLTTEDIINNIINE
jgi:hypothetical protein